MDQLLAELRTTLDFITSGEFFGDGPFKDIPPELKRLNDIAFSGDGEPTTYKNSDEIISACASLKQELELDDVKMVHQADARMTDEGLTTTGIDETMCCYADKTETWIDGPDDIRWEWYVKKGDNEQLENVVVSSEANCCEN